MTALTRPLFRCFPLLQALPVHAPVHARAAVSAAAATAARAYAPRRRLLATQTPAETQPSSSSVTKLGAPQAFELSDCETPDAPLDVHPSARLTSSFVGASQEPFPREAADILMAPINEEDVEIKPDGLIYLPEIKYRRILNRAFGPGGWALVPRGPHTVAGKTLSREYAMFCLGRFASIARGEQDFFDAESGLATASEGCKSNAMMRCCKDLGVASELWDPVFIREYKSKNCVQVWGVNASGMKKFLWRRRDRTLDAPWKEQGSDTAATAKPATVYKKY
ncbi:hypothetical protein HDU83_007536 [Entophlyctis luteolus]|nr:hypothetical protein HDU82_000071 [Entophlyctis luteolus]KAJ3352880.1 hypothetical protein HDU83_007536 [Entophlyctis luteolus]KAJ3386817.1 hypothetical protein HDU84_001264 [Entophlyctis sp. JEL0112]